MSYPWLTSTGETLYPHTQNILTLLLFKVAFWNNFDIDDKEKTKHTQLSLMAMNG